MVLLTAASLLRWMTSAGNESLKSVGAMQASQIHTWATPLFRYISLLTDSGHLNVGLLNRLVGKVQLGLVATPGASDSLKVQVWEEVLRGFIGGECQQIRKRALISGEGYNSVHFGE